MPLTSGKLGANESAGLLPRRLTIIFTIIFIGDDRSVESSCRFLDFRAFNVLETDTETDTGRSLNFDFIGRSSPMTFYRFRLIGRYRV